jgi:hypothetical protein
VQPGTTSQFDELSALTTAVVQLSTSANKTEGNMRCEITVLQESNIKYLDGVALIFATR